MAIVVQVKSDFDPDQLDERFVQMKILDCPAGTVRQAPRSLVAALQPRLAQRDRNTRVRGKGLSKGEPVIRAHHRSALRRIAESYVRLDESAPTPAGMEQVAGDYFDDITVVLLHDGIDAECVCSAGPGDILSC